VDVRAAAGVGDGLDGSEKILAIRSGDEPAEALEVRVALFAVPGLGMKVGSVAVALPDLDGCIADGLAA
jgi:hypothetical protein